MPAKGRRIASRQAQLGRRRRQSRKTEESGAVTIAAPSDIPQETAAPANGAAAIPAAAAVSPTPAGPATTTTPAHAPRRSGQIRTDRAAAYTHLGAELRRILILAGILLAVLLGLSFAL